MSEVDTLAHCDICFVITIEIATDKSFYTTVFITMSAINNT